MVQEYYRFLDQTLDSDDASTFRNDILGDAIQRKAIVVAALSDYNKLVEDVQELKVRNPDLFSY
jgi:hypothetical protein